MCGDERHAERLTDKVHYGSVKGMTWQFSGRSRRLPPDWSRIRRSILARDPVCRLCGNARSVEVDHRIPGDDHRPVNLQGVCVSCHRSKTAVEARDGLARYWSARQRERPGEDHPGGPVRPGLRNAWECRTIGP